ncbi:MAG TPA: gliding motility-associated C-terminal domain-containing protein [Saprospiraceae bacterium]|jgi:gliding motility-associated-like protein|nr:gliding motility-associated C-terminal domain-containing protein [Saprospiraceae bacterium]HQP75984.1 gliding motility-associated C-terminal domain-containing protein [Saprospiraceae bacterium]HRN34438.1 gliding motility-associated C-terminal domain-containing protein [Saprospiraceae bacterium]HRP83489.1 gliding motility-associated C-terminal domain-containing protein [Saprospiraceae bacterium]
MKAWIAFLLYFLLLGNCHILKAQAINDDCFSATELTNVRSWCSSNGFFNNFSATPSGYGPATCFSSSGHDVWFSFTAIATDITILVKPGSLQKPEIALYAGICQGTIGELNCKSNLVTGGALELYKGGLFPGTVYLIRVQGEDASEGTFDLCLDNYFPPVKPGSDIITASVLCDKSSFIVQNVTGSGSVPNEFKDAPCLADGFTNSETNSTWFKWTCKDAGSLTFVLTPLNAPDDLDFALYELNGDLNTTNRTLLRCEAASCKGQTGLKEGATDISEPPNCDKGQDNWLAPVQLEAGKNYLLGINNFTIGGNGFRIEFGGTSTFEGPVADFEILSDTVFCREEQIGIKDLSHNSTGTIEKIQWIFGQDATPSIDSIQGDKTISYLKRGQKFIVQTVTSDKGCVVSTIKPVEILCCGPLHEMNLYSDTTITLGDSVDLHAEAFLEGNQIFYFWEPPGLIQCQGCPANNIKTFHDQVIVVKATDQYNCEAKDSIQIRVDVKRPIFFPNVFSPNYDGINDRFTGYGNFVVRTIDYLRIFNRWGALVWEGRNIPANDEKYGWDGTFKGREVNPDVYVYIAKVTFIDDQSFIYEGSITVVR